MGGAFLRALGRGLRAVGQGLNRRRAGLDGHAQIDNQPEPPPDKYVWHRYQTDLCDACRSKEGRAFILVHHDGRIEGSPEDIPPEHPNCDCAMQNQRTGRFAFNQAGAPR